MKILPDAPADKRWQEISDEYAVLQSSARNQTQDFQGLMQSLLGNIEERSSIQRTEESVSQKAESSSDQPAETLPLFLPMQGEDFAALRTTLESAGCDPQVIRDLQDRLDNNSLSWGDFSREISRKTMISTKSSLTEVEQGQFSGILQKLGFSSDESRSLIQALTQGERKKILAMIQRKVELSKEDKTFSLGEREASLLAKVFGLSQEDGARLQSLFQGKEIQGGMNKSGLQSLLAFVGQSVAKDEQLQDEIWDRVKKEVSSRLKMAVERSELLQKASNEGANSSGSVLGDKTSQAGKTGVQDTRNGLLMKDKTEAKTDFSQVEDDSKDGWSSFWNKMKTEPESGTTVFRSVQSQAGASQGTVLNLQDANSRLVKVPAQEIFDQVEGGLLRNLGQGKRQLILRLDPPELGKVQVLLKVQDNEVQAVIRTSNADVSKAVSEQIAQIRESLEGQGLKVTRLEVQNQLDQDVASNHWSGLEHHNETQEQLTQEARRMRFLASDRLGTIEAEEMPPSHLTMTASSGLDLFA